MAVTAYQVSYNGDSNGYVPAIADRRLYNSLMAVSNSAGFVQEPTITVSGLNVTVTNGWGIIYGCEFLIDNEAVSVSGVAGTYLLILRLNVTSSTAELVFVDSSTSLVQEDINNGGSIYEMAILQCVNNGTTITEHTVQYTVLNTNSAVISDIQTTLAAKTNTKVKGNAESSYRTGNVNLTPANIGAVPTSRTVNGKALSSDITLNINDIGATAQSIGAMPVGTSDAEMSFDQFLNTYWGDFSSGFSTVMLTESITQNYRATIFLYKISNNTGFAFVYRNRTETIDGVAKNVMYVMRLSSNQWTKYSFYSDATS